MHKSYVFSREQRTSKGGTRMQPMTSKEGIELEIQIEELEAKLAPGGETVLPLPGGGHGHHH